MTDAIPTQLDRVTHSRNLLAGHLDHCVTERDKLREDLAATRQELLLAHIELDQAWKGHTERTAERDRIAADLESARISARREAALCNDLRQQVIQQGLLLAQHNNPTTPPGVAPCSSSVSSASPSP